jgi:hypothetical protein
MYASGRGVEQRFDQSAPSSTSSTFLPSSLLARLTSPSPRSDSAAAHNFALAAATGDSFAQVLLPLMLLLLMQL